MQGNSKVLEDGSDELSREFKREFKLPDECNPDSIKAELDEKTRQLKLVGLVELPHQNPSAADHKLNSSSMASTQSVNIGTVREIKSTNTLEYEIYLGNELKDGQIIFEVPNINTLHIKVIKNDEDAHGDLSLELRREIKLPAGARLNNIDHGVDTRTKTLLIKVPLNI